MVLGFLLVVRDARGVDFITADKHGACRKQACTNDAIR